MAHYSFESYEQQAAARDAQQPKNWVSYFALSNDGDEAVVRFNYSSPQELEITSVHTVTIGDKQRRVSCLRTPYEPIDNCPLCAAGEKPVSKIFIKLIEYVRNDQGQIVPVAKIWERPVAFARLLRTYFDEYGSLSDFVFKIKRHGKRGDTSTTYETIPANPAIYKPEIYVKDFSAFENYSLSSYVVLEKSYDELKAIMNGTYVEPIKQKATVQEAVQPTPTYQQQTPIQPTYTAGTQPITAGGYVNTTQSAPVQPTYTNPGNPAVQPAPQVQNIPTQTEQPQQEFINKGPRRYTY